MKDYDPWVTEYLKGQARRYGAHVGSEVTVHRYMQRPVTGQLMRVAGTQLVIAGFGIVPVAEIERVEVK